MKGGPDLILRDASRPGRGDARGENADRASAGRGDLYIEGGRLAEAPGATPSGASVREYRLDGRLVLPGLIDLHHHLDKAFSLPETGVPGDLPTAIAAMAAYQGRVGRAEMLGRGLRLIDQAASFGVSLLRTHVNIGGAYGLRGLEVALELRERVRSRVTVQVVAMASAGVVPGQSGWSLMEGAAASGCDLLGGSIGVRADPVPLLDGLFTLAVRHGLPLDLHVDEQSDPRCPGLEALIPRALAAGYQGRVTASHCSALGLVPASERAKLIEGLARAGIAVVANPLTNLFLQGRGDGGDGGDDVPGVRGIAPVRLLLRAGVRVACASDNVQDAYLPYGNGDPLLAAFVLGLAGQLTTADERDALVGMVTTEAARIAGLTETEYGLEPGDPADLVVLDAAPPDHPVASLPARWLVVHGGRVVKAMEVFG